MTDDPLPAAETVTLKGHTWTTDDYSTEILCWDLPRVPTFRKQIKALKTKDPACMLSLSLSLSLSLLHAFAFPHPLFPQGSCLCLLSPKLQQPFFCLCNFFLSPRSAAGSFLLPPGLSK